MGELVSPALAALVLSRLLPGLLVNAALAGVGLAAGAMEWTGATAGAGLGLVIYLGLGWRGYLLLATFVVLGSSFTRLGYRVKAAHGVAQERKGVRTWRNAAANCAVAAGCAAGALLTGAPGWVVAFAGSLTAALADTSESELGSLAGLTGCGSTYLPWRMRLVPAGTEGAISWFGSLAGLLVAALMGLNAHHFGLLNQPAMAAAVVGGWLATFVESLVAAGHEYDNELLNTFTTAVGAALAVALWSCW